MNGVDIKLEARLPGDDALARIKVPRGEKLHWRKNLRHYSTDMTFIVNVNVYAYICLSDYEILLDSFIAFDAKWIESSWNSPEHEHEKFEWTVNERGAVLTSNPKLQLHEFSDSEYSWKHVLLIFILTNQFSNQKDLVLSFRSDQQGVVPSQEILPYGQKIVRAQRFVSDDQRINLKCCVRVVPEMNAHFKMFDSSWPGEINAADVGIKKYEWGLNEHQATMSYPTNHAEMYN